MHPVFGDFLVGAHDGITAAVSTSGELPGDAKVGVICQLDRLVTTLARYVGDIPLASEFDRLQARQNPGTGGREALEARIALRRSAQVLHSAVLSTTGDVSAGEPHPVARHLAGAATQLAAGRDLLHTHFSPDPATGARNRASAWAKAIYTPSITDALLSEIASMAAQLAPWMMRLSLESSPDSAMAASAGLALHDASRWLWTAGLKLETRICQQPPPTKGWLVLTAIPANLPPTHHPVPSTETIPDLCAGVITTTARLQHATATFARSARWSPQATSASWRRNALAAAITADSSTVILHTLTRAARALGLDPLIQAHLDNTLLTLKPVTTAWRAVTAEWGVLSTGVNRGKDLNRVAAEMGDLILRVGRLAYLNREWTPACSHASIIRHPTSLAATTGDIGTVIAAVHHASDTLTHIAVTDLRCIHRAAADSRLYIPTRMLSADHDFPYQHAPAPRSRVTTLLDSYRLAVKTCTAATQAFDDLALAAGAPSHVLAAAHTRPTPGSPLPAVQPAELALEPPPEDSPSSQISVGAIQPGHLEEAVRDLQLTEPTLLVRASAIDEAGRDLLTGAIAKAHRQASAASASYTPPSASRRRTA